MQSSRNLQHDRSMHSVLRRLVFSALLGAATLLTTTTGRAQLVALDFDDSTASSSNIGSWMLGYGFHVKSPITVTGLAYWDAGADGLVETHAVGLWTNAGGSPLASALLPAGTGAALLSGWRYVDVAPVALGIGDYVVAGTHSAGADPYSDYPMVYTVLPEISYRGSRFVRIEDTNLTFPKETYAMFGYFGGNFVVGSGTETVPEPSTYGLFAAGTLVGLAAWRRRRR